jgi:hypothetical protein
MPFGNLPNNQILWLLLVLMPICVLLLAACFSDSLYRASAAVKDARLPLISHLPWNRPSPPLDDKWYGDDGTPLAYQAWRVKHTESLSPEPTARSTIINYGARVACCLSSGEGVWIKHAIPLELDFLGLSRFKDTQRSFDNNTEDAFCVKMRMIGAEFWSLPPSEAQDLKCSILEKCVEPQIRGHLGIAWAEGGGACLANLTEARKKWGPGLKGYNNAKLMDHRCDISQTLGGVYCFVDPKLCKAMWCHQYLDHCDEAGLLS